MPELKRKPTPMPGTIQALEYQHHHYHASTSTRRGSCGVTASPPFGRNHLQASGRQARRRSCDILNYIDHIIDKGVPTPQQQLTRSEIIKPYTRLSCSDGSGSTASATTAPMEDSLSSLESYSSSSSDDKIALLESPASSKVSETKKDPRSTTPTTTPMEEDSISSLESSSCGNEMVSPLESPPTFSKVSEKKEDRPQTIALWAWDSGRLLFDYNNHSNNNEDDGEIDIWDEISLSKRHRVQSSS